jgi:DNA repair protein SbcC/Rad50
MLLQQLKLKNIRSYQDQTIIFPEGALLLSGDIGSGKSTILLAIEFALFGTSRPDLPSELLLRKGENQASVELTFSLPNQEVIIARNLKKDKATIKQVAGHIILNGAKKDLTALELKSEILNLLGYPEEYLTKNKNYIFRYTIYTPQEEMKLILQENPELRLDTLRKIFNIDKYRTIRDSLQVYLKQTRTKLAVLRTRIEPLEEQKKILEQRVIEKETVNRLLQEQTPEIDNLRRQLGDTVKKIEVLEINQKNFVAKQQQLKTIQTRLQEKTEHLWGLERKNIEIQQRLKEFPEGSKVDVELRLQQLELKRNHFVTKKSTLLARTSTLQSNIARFQKEIKDVREELIYLPKKIELLRELKLKLSEKDNLVAQRTQLEEQFSQTSELVTKNEVILQESKKKKERIFSLDTCPTCLQNVSELHKHRIIEEESANIELVQKLCFDSQKKKEEFNQQKMDNHIKLEELFKIENLHSSTELELNHLESKSSHLESKENELRFVVQENNQLMSQLGDLENQNHIDEIDKEISRNRETFNKLQQKEFLQLQLGETSVQRAEIKEHISKLQHQKYDLDSSLTTQKDLSENILKERSVLMQLTQQEKKLAIEQAQLQTQFNNLDSRQKEIILAVEKMKKDQDQLIRLRGVYNWLEQHFLKLTYTIEKQVMTNIYHLFNQLFQEWFSILIDDENVYSRLDDSFTPIIEQNGYEISFSNLSGGEKTSASLAYRLALNRVINDIIHQVKTKNLLILDEPTDGFSSEQLDKVRDVLDRLNLRQTIIVSHESKIESFVENVIRVVKTSHVSSVY